MIIGEKTLDTTEIIVSGVDFLGKGITSQEQKVIDLFKKAEKEISILTFSLTQLDDILNPLKTALQRGVSLKLIYGTIDKRRPDLHKRIMKDLFNNSEYVDFYFYSHEHNIFHAKVIVVDRKEAIIGSANFTYQGYKRNHEIGVYLKGKVVNDINHLIDSFIENCPNLKYFDEF